VPGAVPAAAIAPLKPKAADVQFPGGYVAEIHAVAK